MQEWELIQLYEKRKDYNREGNDYELLRLACYMAGRVLVANGAEGALAWEPAKDASIRSLADMFIGACAYVGNELVQEGKDVESVRFALIKAIQDIKAACRGIGAHINVKEGQSKSGEPDNVVFEVNIRCEERLANTDIWVNVAQERLIDEIYQELCSLLYHILKAMGKDIASEDFEKFKDSAASIIMSLECRERAL